MDLHTILSNAAKDRAAKLGKKHFAAIGSKSRKKLFAGKTKDEISEYMRRVRSKIRVDKADPSI